MLEAKIFSKAGIDDFDGHCDEVPAFVADIGFVAACSDLIVIRQIEIEYEFFGDGAEGGGFAEGFAIAWVGGIYWTDLEAGGIQL